MLAVETSSREDHHVAEFALEVRDHIMIAHSLPDSAFGRAQGMHGATFVVDVTFFREELNASCMVLNSGMAHEALKAILAPLHFGNLDEHPDLKGKLTTTEFLCRHIFEQMAEVIADGFLGDDGKAVCRMRVTLTESHVSKAWYEASLRR
jgi:6-pyruvoyl-tetrahydropterin synthase